MAMQSCSKPNLYSYTDIGDYIPSYVYGSSILSLEIRTEVASRVVRTSMARFQVIFRTMVV